MTGFMILHAVRLDRDTQGGTLALIFMINYMIGLIVAFFLFDFIWINIIIYFANEWHRQTQ